MNSLTLGDNMTETQGNPYRLLLLSHITLRLQRRNRSCLRRKDVLGIHRINLRGIIAVNHRTLHFQRIGQFALLQTERFGQQGDAFHLLIMGKLLLQSIDAKQNHFVYIRIATQISPVRERNMMTAGKIPQQLIFGHNQCGK